ncbi:putative translation elongation factor EF1B/ribosomal protein S6 [Rosa chinensis]|uniref:Putative translation elongation factor EF1B/ribosomal protein S6 n=1 Tax=Rosa chinensis TaxID=74649 RepID=A0A2P6P501_ROSCH|nr:putative translation elongation factor EF1B/ribosomal protein S6 [Rosa chinensis]
MESLTVNLFLTFSELHHWFEETRRISGDVYRLEFATLLLFTYQASKDDITVLAALAKPPSSEYVNVLRWYKHIEALLRISGVSGEGCGVTIKGDAPASAAEEDDDDVDLFGEETEEEKKAAQERAACVKASAKKKESGKSSVLMDVKPWDDETDMQKLLEAVKNVQMEGLHWGASKLVPVGYGI